MAIVKKYKSKLINLNLLANNIFTLEFEPINGRFKYSPGQFLHLAYDEDYDGTGQWPESRCFSMQSSPTENILKITYSVKGTFTRKLAEKLNIGSEVWLKLPFGDLFTQEHNKINTVFIAGGTGITPFLSLFTDPSFKEYVNPRVYLGFRNSSLNIYKSELNKALENNKSLSISIFYQDIDGVINIDHILKKSDPLASFFISGPPLMIANFKNFLIKGGIGEAQIKTDDWE